MYRTLKLSVTLALCLSCWPTRRAPAADKTESTERKRGPDVVFVPTPDDIVTKMLQMAGVTKDDVLYDPGCGDGRIVVTAAKKFGCRGVGIDISSQRVKEAVANARRNNVDKLVKIVEQDIYEVDLSEATVVALYLLPSMNVKLIPQLQKLKPGSRIVAHDYGFEGRVKPDKSLTVTSKEDAVEHHIMLWKTPLTVEPAEKADQAEEEEE
jgi:precorrin-6B methylase 2